MMIFSKIPVFVFVLSLFLGISYGAHAACDPYLCKPSDLDCQRKDLQLEIKDLQRQKGELNEVAKILVRELDAAKQESDRLKAVSNEITKDMSGAAYAWSFFKVESAMVLSYWDKAVRGAMVLISRAGNCAKQCNNIRKASRMFRAGSKAISKGQIGLLAQLAQYQQCDENSLGSLGSVLIPGGLDGVHCVTKPIVLNGLNQMIAEIDNIIEAYAQQIIAIKSEFKFIDSRIKDLEYQISMLKCGDDL